MKLTCSNLETKHETHLLQHVARYEITMDTI